MPKKPKRLTALLTELGGDHVLNAAGETVSRDEALAGVMWDLALGYEYKDDDGVKHVIAPDRDIAKFIFERREGRVPTAMADDRGVQTADDRVGALARSRINSQTDAVLEADSEDAVSEHTRVLDVPPDGTSSSEGPDT